MADANIAWHAPPNPHSIGIEICSEVTYTREQWLSPQVWPAVLRAAQRTRELCQRHDIPLKKIGPADLLSGARGICGHVDVSQAWHQSTHTDPGPNFPWVEFIVAVINAASDPTSNNNKVEVMRYVNLDNQSNAKVDRSALLTIDPVGTSLVMPTGSRAWLRWAVFFPFKDGKILAAGDTATTARFEWLVFNIGGKATAQAPFDLRHRSTGTLELPKDTTSVEVVIRGLPPGGAVGLHLDGVGHA